MRTECVLDEMSVSAVVDLIKDLDAAIRDYQIFPMDNTQTELATDGVLTALQNLQGNFPKFAQHVTLSIGADGKLYANGYQVSGAERFLKREIVLLGLQDIRNLFFAVGYTRDEMHRFMAILAMAPEERSAPGSIEVLLDEAGIQHICLNQVNLDYDRKDPRLEQLFRLGAARLAKEKIIEINQMMKKTTGADGGRLNRLLALKHKVEMEISMRLELETDQSALRSAIYMSMLFALSEMLHHTELSGGVKEEIEGYFSLFSDEQRAEWLSLMRSSAGELRFRDRKPDGEDQIKTEPILPVGADRHLTPAGLDSVSSVASPTADPEDLLVQPDSHLSGQAAGSPLLSKDCPFQEFLPALLAKTGSVTPEEAEQAVQEFFPYLITGIENLNTEVMNYLGDLHRLSNAFLKIGDGKYQARLEEHIYKLTERNLETITVATSFSRLLKAMISDIGRQGSTAQLLGCAARLIKFISENEIPHKVLKPLRYGLLQGIEEWLKRGTVEDFETGLHEFRKNLETRSENIGVLYLLVEVFWQFSSYALERHWVDQALDSGNQIHRLATDDSRYSVAVRDAALTSLCRLGETSYIGLLRQQVVSDDRRLRLAAMNDLQTYARLLRPFLFLQLQDESWHVRRNCMHILATEVMVKDINAILPLLEDESWQVRREAIRALSMIAKDSSSEEWSPYLDHIRSGLESCLHMPYFKLQFEAVRCITTYCPVGSSGILIQFYENPGEMDSTILRKLRTEILTSLGQIAAINDFDRQIVIPFLVRLLQSKGGIFQRPHSVKTKKVALHALVLIGGDEARTAFQETLPVLSNHELRRYAETLLQPY